MNYFLRYVCRVLYLLELTGPTDGIVNMTRNRATYGTIPRNDISGDSIDPADICKKRLRG
ncbi:hypothetical protein EMIT0P44_250064 [Pseudomonas sp. IT-P44]